MPVRGVRGANSCPENTQKAILEATRELLEEIIARNELTDFSEVVSAIFTTTPDLNASFPAEAARGLGMGQVPLLCASEIAVPTGLPKIIRILLHVNTEKSQADMVHIYLGEARALRKDLTLPQ